jgi:uncharacterized membrane protein YkoI
MKKLLVLAAALTLIGSSALADGDKSKREKLAKIDKKAAEAIAIKEFPGTIVDIDIEKMRKKPYSLYWSISVKGDSARKNIHIDANDGKVIKVTDETDDK